MSLVVLIAIWAVAFPALELADANDELAVCRRIIVRLGDDSKAPADPNCMGLSYAYGLNHKKDLGKAATWFRKAAEQNYAPAQSWLGFFYEKGHGVKADAAEAVKWFRKSADQNNADGLFHMGRVYENGIGVTKDLGQARTYYTKAAAAGARDASLALANLGSAPPTLTPVQEQINEGKRMYKAKDFAGAAKLFQKLAEQGDPKGQYLIAYQYERGEGVRQSYDEAVRWYRKSAEQGYVEAQNYLGMIMRMEPARRKIGRKRFDGSVRAQSKGTWKGNSCSGASTSSGWRCRRTGRKRSAGSTRPGIKATAKPTILPTI